jgi:predicted amidohydrolase YtcJ
LIHTLAFGTDYPMERITPFRGLYAGMTRRDETRNTHFLGTPLSIGEALAAYTSGPAFAEFAETKSKAVARQRS